MGHCFLDTQYVGFLFLCYIYFCCRLNILSFINFNQLLFVHEVGVSIFYTVCPRSSDPFYVVTYYIKWVTTSLKELDKSNWT